MANDDATPMLVWTGAACAGPPGYGYGGWAWLNVQGAASASGAAGGERHTTTSRMALRVLIEALKAALDAPRAPIQLDPGDADVARIGADLAARQAAGWRDAEGEPIEHPELWQEIAALIARRAAPVRFVTAAGPSEPRRFADAWTAFAQDKCKMKGAFTSAIPRPNLQTLLAKRARA